MQNDPPRPVLSHPAIRPLPPLVDRPRAGGPDVFIATNGDDAADGSEKTPLRTINHALRRAEAGQTIYLRGGTYFESVYCAVAGTADAPITLRSFPGERVIIDGGIPEFQLDPANAWQPAADGVPGEFVSSKAYRNIRDVVGLFGDSNIGLQTYWDTRDFRAENELYSEETKRDPKPIWCGPGLWYDKLTGRIHVRLAHTHIKPCEDHLYEKVNYEGETDPRKMPMVVAPFASTPLFVDQGMYVRFQDLAFRGAGYVCVRLNFAVGVEFDGCTIYGGTYPIWSKGAGPLKMTHCGVHGMIPPWGTRWENSLRVYKPDQYPPFIPDKEGTRHFSRLPTHALIATEGGYEFEVFYFPHNHDWDISYCEFSDSHDGIYLSGSNIRFHHNVIDALQDDGIYISAPTPHHTTSVYVYQNVIASGITAFGAHARGGPEGDIYVFRNVIDLRKSLHWERPTAAAPEGKFWKGHSVFFMHGSNRLLHEEAMHFYQNTALLRSIFYAGATYASMQPGVPRRSFNNVFLYEGGLLRPFAIPNSDRYDLQMDGNLHWHITQGEKPLAPMMKLARALPLSEASRKGCPDGQEAHAIIADPKLLAVQWDKRAVNDYRLSPQSPAVGKGVALPAAYEDPFRPADNAAPDIGAFPLGSEPLRVGIRGRVTAGNIETPR